jgi:citrate lyase subunit beta/citryl-CoA lyase
MVLPTRLRSVLFAPAVRPDLVAKTALSGPDAVVIDLEDATPVNAKAAARADLASLVATVNDVAVLVRVNAVDTEWFADDIAALPATLTGVVVPKIETTDGLDAVANALADVGQEQLPMFGGIETALGVADARPLLAHPSVGAAYFGAEDFIADMGGVRTAGNDEVAHARSVVALAGRLARTPVVDQVVADFRDDDRFVRECAEARAMGYARKLCIHPGQVGLANSAWTPSDDELDEARRLIAAYEAASVAGVAAIDFEGRMVDEPVAVQARRLLTLADEALES